MTTHHAATGAEAEVARLQSEVAALQREVSERRCAEALARAQATALARALELLTTEPEVDTFLNLVLGVMAEHLEVRAVALWFHDRADDTLHFDRVYEPGRGRGGEGGRVQLGAELGHYSALAPVASSLLPVWAEMNRARAPVVVADVATDPRMDLYREVLAPLGIETVLHVPLLLPEGAIGYLGAGTKRREYSGEQLAVTQAMAHQMTVAVQLARLAAKQSRDAQAAAVLDERNRIAREIHDTLAQTLTGVVVQMEAARRVAGEPRAVLEHLERTGELAREGLREARRSVRALRPALLDGSTLARALASLCARIGEENPSTCVEFGVSGAPRDLPAEVEENLLRIAQEALANVARHASAKAAWVELKFEPGAVNLRVQDDGRGFDTRESSETGGFGLLGMRERVASLSGSLEVSSRAGQGTEVRACAPLEGALD